MFTKVRSRWPGWLAGLAFYSKRSAEMRKNNRTKWKRCLGRWNLFVVIQVLAISGYFHTLFADTGASVNVWYPSSTLSDENWYHWGTDSLRVTPCMFTITDNAGGASYVGSFNYVPNNELEIYGIVTEQSGQRVCQALVSASSSSRADGMAGTFDGHLGSSMPLLNITSTSGCFHTFRQYLIRSPEFMVLPQGSQTPEELRPSAQNSPLPLPTVTSNDYTEDWAYDVLGSFSVLNEAGVAADPSVFFDCLNNVEACPHEAFNSTFCPAGYFRLSYLLHTCSPCEEGTYQDFSGLVSECTSITQCHIPFTTLYQANTQRNNLCDCADSARFILEPYELITHSFVYNRTIENVTIVNNSPDLPANYWHVDGSRTPYESLCILPAGFCEARDANDQPVYGIYFQYGDRQSDCYVSVTDGAGEVVISQYDRPVICSDNLQAQCPAVTPASTVFLATIPPSVLPGPMAAQETGSEPSLSQPVPTPTADCLFPSQPSGTVDTSEWPWWGKVTLGIGSALAGSVVTGVLLVMGKQAYNHYMHPDKEDTIGELAKKLRERQRGQSERAASLQLPMGARNSFAFGPDGGSVINADPVLTQGIAQPYEQFVPQAPGSPQTETTTHGETAMNEGSHYDTIPPAARAYAIVPLPNELPAHGLLHQQQPHPQTGSQQDYAQIDPEHIRRKKSGAGKNSTLATRPPGQGRHQPVLQPPLWLKNPVITCFRTLLLVPNPLKKPIPLSGVPWYIINSRNGNPILCMAFHWHLSLPIPIRIANSKINKLHMPD